MVKIHYFYDPMCGWCYGASDLVAQIEQTPNLELVMHPGGMIEKQAIAAQFRKHILAADKHIAELTGANFGSSYQQKVASDTELVLDSYQTTRAILTAQKMGFSPLAMLTVIQKAHYQDGLEVYQSEVLAQLAAQNHLDSDRWHEIFNSLANELIAEISQSQAMMAMRSVKGFPTLIAQVGDNWLRIPHTEYYQNRAAWREFLDSLANQ